MALTSIGDIAVATLTEQTVSQDLVNAQMLARRANDYRATVIEQEGPAFTSTAQMYARRNHGSQTRIA